MDAPFARAAAILALATGVAWAQPLAGQARTLVEEVRFEGNETFPDDSLARVIATRETQCKTIFLAPLCWMGIDFAEDEAYLARRELPRDELRLRIFYHQRGFRETEVDTATSRNDEGAVTVEFRIEEGRPVLVDSVEIFGLEDFDESDLLDGLPLQKGDRLSTPALEETRDRIQRRLRNRGYAHAAVLRSSFIPNNDRYSATVTFDAVPGPRARYGHIEVRGNENLSELTVLRTLQFRAGDVFRADQIAEAQARLFGLEIIRSASVVPDLESGPDSIVPVTVEITESDPHRVRAGGGWTNAECFNAEARWVSRNFFGGARRLQLRGRVSNVLADEFRDLLCPDAGTGPFADLIWLGSVDFNQPWIFSTRNSFQASLFAERQSVPSVFIREAVGLSLALTRAIGPRTPATVSYRPELSRLNAAEILFCINFLVCRPGDIDALQGANWLAPVGASFSRTTTNNVLNPSRGYTALIDLEHAAGWTGSNFRYDRVLTEGAWYQPVGRSGTIVAARARAGWVGSGAFSGFLGQNGDDERGAVVHPQKRFYAGGANSVRGFAQNRLGPRVLTANVQDLLDPEQGGCSPAEVADRSCDPAGLVEDQLEPRPTGGSRLFEGSLEVRVPFAGRFQWAGFTDFGQVWQPGSITGRSLTMTPGTGIRFFSPIGPLRLDVAYRFQGGEDLPVVTNQVRAYDPAVDAAADRLVLNGEPIPWVRTTDLAILEPLYFYGESGGLSWRRFQIHLSIGQAF